MATAEAHPKNQVPNLGYSGVPDSAEREGPVEERSSSQQQYVFEPAWSQLSTLIDDVRDLLTTELDDHEEAGYGSSLSTPEEPPSSFAFVVGLHGSLHIDNPEITLHPAAHVREALFSVYCQNVHTVCKVVHRPTLRSQIGRIQDSPLDNLQTAAENALLFAVYAAAIVSLQDSEWSAVSATPRANVLRQYMFVIEYYLHQANVLESRDLTVLQAFVLYLIVARVQNRGQRHWVLLVLAIRLAREQGLDCANVVNKFRPIQREIALRLWVVLRTLDFRSIFERGSVPVMQLDTFDTPEPTNIDEDDIRDDLIPQSSLDFNSGTLGVLHTAGMTLWMKLYKMNLRTSDAQHSDISSIWASRLQLVDEYENEVLSRFHNPENMDAGEYSLLQHIFRALCCLGRLLALRPLLKEGNPLPSYPAQVPRQILDLAIQSLRAEQNLFDNPALAGYRWANWVHWYPLAVALVEIRGNPTIICEDDIWTIVQTCYERQGQQIAQTATKTPWRLIERLMKHVRALRTQYEADTSIPWLTAPGQRTSLFYQPPTLFASTTGPIVDANALHSPVATRPQEVTTNFSFVGSVPHDIYNDQVLSWDQLLDDTSEFMYWAI